MKRLSIAIAVWSTFLGLIRFPSSEACTLWGAAGKSVEGGGTLIAKNRDWAPDHRQELTILKGAGGYKFLALKAVGGSDPGIKAGVNEKGLVIVSATANQVTSAERKKFQQKKELMGHFLATCASVQEVLNRVEWMQRPVFYMVGDGQELAFIEIAPGGRRSVARRNSGTLAHTNHYCRIEAQNLRKPGRSSTQRYARIEELLRSRNTPFAIEDFIRFSQDRNDGPDNSIWRTGSNPHKTRTLATWLVSIPASGSPRLYLKTADPEEPERVCRLSVGDALRRNDRQVISPGSDLCQ
jgi:isopenicillin-N N-acyltransferase-like protein